MKDKIVEYEILALDPKEESKAKSAKAVAHGFLGVSDLWSDAIVDSKKARIDDGSVHLQVAVVEKDANGDEATARNGYFLKLKGPLERVGSMREGILAHLHGSKFSPLYVLRDEVSEEISRELYPLLYQVENALRRYLIKFMSTRIGSDWWDSTVSNEVSTKAKQRKKNERVFSAYINNETYLIDFGELGELVFAQTSGFVTREDIIEKITRMKETPEAVKEIKSQVQTNYQRFFKETFADVGFQDRWKKFEKIRNKIAHCNLFTLEDLEAGRELAKELSGIIEKADSKTQTVEITSQEREAIQERVIERSARESEITEELLLTELEEQEAKFKRTHPDGFVGLNRFMNIHLGQRGFDHYSVKDLCEKLEQDGKVEIYHVHQPGSEFSTAAIRVKRK